MKKKNTKKLKTPTSKKINKKIKEIDIATISFKTHQERPQDRRQKRPSKAKPGGTRMESKIQQF